MSDDELRKLVNCVQLVDIRTVSVEGRIDISGGVSEAYSVGICVHFRESIL